MNKVFYQSSLIRFIRSKKGKALDLASGNESFTKLLLKNHWYVDSVDFKKKNRCHKKNYSFIQIDLEKIRLSKIKRKLNLRKYDLIILFRFLHRPLFKIIPLLMKKNGLFFCETFMIQNGEGKLNSKKNMLLEKELFNLKSCKLNLLKFYQGKDLQKGNIIQTAIFKKFN
tara:strand:- start:2650 stop:3159 length:510 start_codon:yes stop_codon:yes gene_type:complete